MHKIAVIGLGQFGQTVAETLTQEGAEVLVIDKNEKIIEDFKDKVALAVVADATDEDALKAQGIENFDVVIVATGAENFLTTILVTALLKKLGVKKVVARGIRTSDSHLEERILELVGADRVILSSVETAKRLAQEILGTHILSYIPISAGYSLIKIKAPKKFADQAIKDLKLRDRFKVNLIGIERDEEVNYLPRSSEIIKIGDLLIIVGREGDVEKFSKIDGE
ncbi:MAG: potassium channel family protein [Patescibacteria group bacterium]